MLIPAVPPLPLLLNIVLGILVHAARQEEERDGITAEMKKTIITLRWYDHVNNLSVDSLEFLRKFKKCDYKTIFLKNQFYFYMLANNALDNEINSRTIYNRIKKQELNLTLKSTRPLGENCDS